MENISKKNINKGMHYLKLAANNMYPSALNYLGGIYTNGEYIPQDIEKGIYYLTLTANKNVAHLQYFLG